MCSSCVLSHVAVVMQQMNGKSLHRVRNKSFIHGGLPSSITLTLLVASPLWNTCATLLPEQCVSIIQPPAFHFRAHVNRLEQPHSLPEQLNCSSTSSTESECCLFFLLGAQFSKNNNKENDRLIFIWASYQQHSTFHYSFNVSISRIWHRCVKVYFLTPSVLVSRDEKKKFIIKWNCCAVMDTHICKLHPFTEVFITHR